MASISGGASLHVIPSPITIGIASDRTSSSVVRIRSPLEVNSVLRPHCDVSFIKHSSTISRSIRLRRSSFRRVAASAGAEDSGDNEENLIEIPPTKPLKDYVSGPSTDESVVDPSLSNPRPLLSSLKLQLLALVVGLDRGLAVVSVSETEAAEKVAAELEAAFTEGRSSGGDADTGFEEKLQGRWRLVYSSGFASTGSLGGTRPGPPAGVVPPLFKLGQVYQRIDVLAKELDNIVCLNVASPWPLPPLQVVATLAHSYTIEGDNIQIIFEKTSVKFEGSGWISQVPPFEVPQIPPDILKPFKTLRRGTFRITFLDEDMRITRGDRGELRVFVLA